MVNPRFVIKAVLSGQRLNINVPLTVAGTVNYIGVEAKCTSEWDDCTVVCYIHQIDTGYIAQLGLIYDEERKLYYFPNAERLTLTAGEWSIWFVGVVAESGQEKYKVTSETRYFNVYPNPFASSIPPGDISLDEEAIARATDAQNKANLLLDKYNAGELTGPQGDPGDPAHIGFVQASVDNTTDNPSCEVSVTESPDNTYNMQFTFSGIKGAKGDTGATGPKGDTGATGAPGRDGTDGRDGVDGETIDDYVLVQAEQPTSETNKMWLKPTASGDPIMIPSAEEFQELQSAFDYGIIIGSSAMFESGGFSTQGTNQNNARRLRTIGYLPSNVKTAYTKNGYKFGIYCYNKGDNSYAGFVYTNGNVGLDTTQFTYRTSFDFDNPAYSGYNFRLLCAAPNTQSNITVAESNNFILVKDGAKSFTANSIEDVPVLAYNAYIRTEVGYGNTVSLLPITYNSFVCAICECKEGDTFTVTGTGGGSGRLWSFIDSNNALLSAAGSSISVCSEVIVAPANSAKAIFNASSAYDYNFTKGNISNFTSCAKAELIRSAVVHGFPTAIARPTIAYKAAVNQVQGVSDVKGSIFRNDNDFCIIYNENLDGNDVDLPSVSGTGTLAIKYKFFHYENGVESNVSYGEIARKGDTYTTWDDNTAQFDGGCGAPSGVNGIQYFSSAYTGTKRYNGMNNYGLRPCACEVTVTSNGVSFGEIKELSLTINGVKGAFDVSRINPSYENYYLYYTTTPPCKVSDTLWYWLQPVIHGIAAFKSTNGFDWVLIGVAKTPYQPQCEVTCVPIPNSNHICFAARTRETTNQYTESNIYIGKMYIAIATIFVQYKMQSITSRGYLVRDDKGILLFYNPTSYNEIVCIRVTPNGNNYQFFFHRWFSLYKDCTWYTAPDASSFVSDYTKFFLVGNNGNVNENRGLTFMELNVSASPKVIDDMTAGIE